MTRPAVRAVLWDADGVLQSTPAGAWDLAVRVVEQFPDALTGADLDEHRIRAAVGELHLDDHLDEILAVWSTFDLLGPSFEVVEATRAAGIACHLATNQDPHRARAMRARPAYREGFDRLYFSCDIGAAKPSAAFFEHIVADLGVAPGMVLFLDDQPGNVAGARSVGLVAERWTHHDGVADLRAILQEHGVALDAGGDVPVREPGQAGSSA